MDCRNKNVYVIKKTLPVSLGRILQFDIYQAALEHTLSLEPTNSEFLKTKDGIRMWLNRYGTFMTSRQAMCETALMMNTILDASPVKYDQWKLHVANNEDVITYICKLLKDVEEASWEEPMESQKSESMEVESQTEEEEPMDIDELTVKFENLKL